MQKTLAQQNAQRGRTLRLLRKIHGWLGLWGAVLGLLFGLTGFLLNHRAVMKIPAAQMEESEIQLSVPQPYPQNAKAFTAFVQRRWTFNMIHWSASHAKARRTRARKGR